MLLSDKDFLSMTLKQFDALAQRHTAERERQDYRSAQIVATLANIYRDTKKRPEPYTPFDFMPGKKPSSVRRQTVDEQMDIVRMLNVAMGGKEL